MCGRFTLKTPPDQWGQLLLPLPLNDAVSQAPELLANWQPRYNIAPTQNILAFTSPGSTTAIALDYYRWGLVPSWAKELSIGNRMINARSETLPEKRSFSGPLAKRRCLVLADGYYEWQKLKDGSKQPYWISPANSGMMLLAGLWESNQAASNKSVQSCTIVTTASNESLVEIHDRMPCVMEGSAIERWLADDCTKEEAHSLLRAAEDDYFTTHQASKSVNNPRNDGPSCLGDIQE